MSQNTEISAQSIPSTDNQPPDQSSAPPTPPVPAVASENFREFPIQNTGVPPSALSDQQLRVIDLLITGTTLTEAAAAVGITVRTIYNWRHRDATFAAEYDARRQMVWDQSLREMRDLIAPAVRVFAEQLRHRHEYPRYRAANAILRIAGVKKALSNTQDHNEKASVPNQQPPAISNPPQNPAQLATADGSPGVPTLIAGVKEALSNAQDHNEQASVPHQHTPATSSSPPNPAQLAAADGSPRSPRVTDNP